MGRRQDGLDKAVKEIGSTITGVQGDASKLEHLDRLVESVKRETGLIDVVYASAGWNEFAPID